jgi:hemerythrin
MTFATWHDDLNIGDSKIDREHRELFEMVNALHDAILREEPTIAVKAIVDRLAQHTIDHFQSEEGLMRRYRYPGYNRHKQVHDNLTRKIIKLQKKLAKQEVAITSDLTAFLQEWLAHHIKGEDRNMILFFQQKAANLATTAR